MKRKRRTKHDIEKNDLILHNLFKKFVLKNENIATGMTGYDLKEAGYIGSLPYSTPTCTKRYAIRQIGGYHGNFSDYSILKLYW